MNSGKLWLSIVSLLALLATAAAAAPIPALSTEGPAQPSEQTSETQKPVVAGGRGSSPQEAHPGGKESKETVSPQEGKESADRQARPPASGKPITEGGSRAVEQPSSSTPNPAPRGTESPASGNGRKPSSTKEKPSDGKDSAARAKPAPGPAAPMRSEPTGTEVDGAKGTAANGPRRIEVARPEGTEADVAQATESDAAKGTETDAAKGIEPKGTEGTAADGATGTESGGSINGGSGGSFKLPVLIPAAIVVLLLAGVVFVLFRPERSVTLGALETARPAGQGTGPQVRVLRTTSPGAQKESSRKTWLKFWQRKTGTPQRPGEVRVEDPPEIEPPAAAGGAVVQPAQEEIAAQSASQVLETGLRDKLRELGTRIDKLENQVELLRTSSAPTPPPAGLGTEIEEAVNGLASYCQQLDQRLARIAQRVLSAPSGSAAAPERRIEAAASAPPEPQAVRPRGPDPDALPGLELELAVLKASWERAQKELPALAALGEDAGKPLRQELLCELPKTIDTDEELRAACASVLAPVWEFESLSSKVLLAQKLVEGTLPPLDQPARQLQRIREGAMLLTMLHSSASFAEKLNFRLEQWAGERFLTFADLFLQKRQQALLQGGLLTQAALEEGYSIVLRVLTAADLEPIEIVLGRTLFDSSQHVGRSTASQPGLRDGAIAGVVRNGFRQRSGRVVRQPEVVVNRL